MNLCSCVSEERGLGDLHEGPGEYVTRMSDRYTIDCSIVLTECSTWTRVRFRTKSMNLCESGGWGCRGCCRRRYSNVRYTIFIRTPRFPETDTCFPEKKRFPVKVRSQVWTPSRPGLVFVRNRSIHRYCCLLSTGRGCTCSPISSAFLQVLRFLVKKNCVCVGKTKTKKSVLLSRFPSFPTVIYEHTHT